MPFYIDSDVTFKLFREWLRSIYYKSITCLLIAQQAILADAVEM